MKENTQDYSRIDHFHCFSRENPPCGQKIEHLKCCLCEKLNPMVDSFLTKRTEEIVDIATSLEASEEMVGDSPGDSAVGSEHRAFGRNQALFDFKRETSREALDHKSHRIERFVQPLGALYH